MKLSAMFIAMLLSVPVMAATKTYQVTGPVTDVKDDAIVVQKGNEKWEIARDPATTKLKGDSKEIKKGDQVTIHYRMSATEVEVKNAKNAATSSKKQPASEKGAAGSSPPSK